VNDEDLIQMAVIHVLEDVGSTVTEAGRGDGALDLIDEAKLYDLDSIVHDFEK
jgi:CheY-like chemotaxis protein